MKSCKDCEYLYIPMKDAEILIKSNFQIIDEILSQLRLVNSENKRLKEQNKELQTEIDELKDELDIHQHHIAELESEEV